MAETTQEERDKLRAVQSMVREDDWSRSLFKALNDADRLQCAEELLDQVLEDNHVMGHTDTKTLNKIEEFKLTTS